MIEFRVLGPLAAAADGSALALGAPKQRALLAELLLASGAVVSRDALVDAIWGDAPPDSALTSLQVYVHGLRKALGDDRIERQGDGYRLRLERDELDADRFEQLVERGRAALDEGDAETAAAALREALALWTGPALAGLSCNTRAASLEERRLQALELRGEAELQLGRHEALLGELEALVREHPYRERFREQQILALYRAGRQKEALDAYRDIRRRLVEELGIEPAPALRELEQAVLRQEPTLAAPGAAPSERRLPTAPTPLVGRHLEVAAVAALLRRDDVRLVTLTGTGGTGKTRLALAAAHELAAESAGGAIFVDLSPVADPAHLPAAIALAIGVGDDSDPFAAVTARLTSAPTVLVLDNLEQLLPEVTVVSHLLAAIPRLRVLATSRAPLRLSGEHEYPVPPLPVPAATATFEVAAANDAVRLFIARARAVDPHFALTDRNLRAVVGICRRLDGLPLALELAAARTRLLPPEQLEQRLGSALDVLVGGARDLPARQRTLRATLDWSWGLLDDDERLALARLSVFSGGASLDAAQAVLGDLDALQQATRLAEHGLLRRAEAARLVLLETIREYALARLREQGDEQDARRRHAKHHLALAERLAQGLLDGTVTTVEEFAREHENLLAAVAWTAGAGEVELQVRLVCALRLYWAMRGNFAEARGLFERAIADSRGAPALHAAALFHGASFAFRRGDLETARSEWTTALGLFTELGDEEEAARCTAELGAIAIAERDLERAERLYREAAAAFAAHGRTMRECAALGNIAAIAAERGDFESAEAQGERVVGLQREVGDHEGLAISLHNLSRVKLRLGHLDEAQRCCAEALQVALQLAHKEILGYGLGSVAEIAHTRGEHELAARLLGAGEAIFEETGVQRFGEEAEAWKRTADALAAELGAERQRELMREGAALQLAQAVAEADAAVR
ncbi:MAG TPA: BTAD domain-containing putative transcriptional regulator [Gaiellaceae bacterium]